MRLQPVDLLADVGLGGQERRLLCSRSRRDRPTRPSAARTCSASRWRIAAGSRDGSASACASAPRCASRWPARSAPSAAPSLRRACFKAGERGVERRQDGRVESRRAPRRSRLSPALRARRAAPAARRRWPGVTPNWSSQPLGKPGQILQESLVDHRLRRAAPACATVSVAWTLPREKRFWIAWRAGCSRRSKPGGSRSRASSALAVDRLALPRRSRRRSCSAPARAKPVMLCNAMTAVPRPSRGRRLLRRRRLARALSASCASAAQRRRRGRVGRPWRLPRPASSAIARQRATFSLCSSSVAAKTWPPVPSATK